MSIVLLNYKQLEYPINDLYYQNVMLIDSTVRDYRLFYNATNDLTFPIIFNYTNTSTEILDLLKSKFTTINRLSIIADSSNLDKLKTFINNQPYFILEDLTSINYSPNLNFMLSLIDTFNINNVDFLACNSLKYNNWKQYYNILSKSNVNIGASNDKTGNIKYGGNWFMESTQHDIQNIYFNNNINLYHETLDVEYWLETSDLSIAKQKTLAVLLPNNKILTCFGYDNQAMFLTDGQSYITSSELYDINSGEYIAQTNTNSMRINATISLLSNGLVLVAGGFKIYQNININYTFEVTNTTEIYDPELNEWSDGPSFIVNRQEHCMVGINNNENIVILGGINATNQSIKSCEMYNVDTASWSSIADMSCCRTKFTATVLLNGDIIVFGGLDENANVLNSYEIYNPTYNTWTYSELTIMNYPRYYHNATLLLDGRILITGGGNGIPCDIYNPATNTCSSIDNFSTNRYFCSAVRLTDGTVLVAGDDYAQYATCMLFDPITNTWSDTKNLNCPRNNSTLIALSNNNAIIIGGNIGINGSIISGNNSIETAKTEIYNFINFIPVTTNNSSETHTYFFNDMMTIDRNTSLFVTNPIDEGTNYDYVISLNNYILADLFDTKTYQQNINDIDNVDINFVINQSIFNDSFNSTSMSTTRSLINGVEQTTDIGTRILEILALKIFGHAKARAAIANDSDIIDNLSSQLYNHFNNVVQNHKYDIFNQYVNYDFPDLNANDSLITQDFNFDNDIISFPGLLSGHLYDNSSGVQTGISSFLNNGPTSGIQNDTQLIDGVYNVPILFKIG